MTSVALSRSHTHTHTRARNSLDGLSARRKGLHLHDTRQKNNHTSDEIRNRNPSSPATADLRLRKRGHRNRPNESYATNCNSTSITKRHYTYLTQNFTKSIKNCGNNTLEIMSLRTIWASLHRR